MVNTGLKSMTGFASARGEAGGWSWVWDLRSVNGRGLDPKLRLPDWIEGLEPALRAAIQARVARGSVTITLRLSRPSPVGAARLDPAALAIALSALAEVEGAAEASGVTLRHSSAADLLMLKGVLEGNGAEADDTTPLLRSLTADLPALFDAFDAMRLSEGRALSALIERQLDTIARLAEDAAAEAEARREDSARALREALARVVQNADGIDPQRVAQELAMIAVKSDITEEIDRLRAHVAAARDLLAEAGPVGRKLDFLTQEFLREANTLCSKSGFARLTRIGLDLKAVIDQMREQVQNVE